MEASRGCPYHCTFCAKDNFRYNYRKRPLSIILAELDGLIAQGVEYVYFIDEIFLPNRQLLAALARAAIKIGMQTRIDLWNEEAMRELGPGGCVSIEAGVESITEGAAPTLDKKCRMSTEELVRRLIFAKKHVPFVQANLIPITEDDMDAVDLARAPGTITASGRTNRCRSFLIQVHLIIPALGGGGRRGVGTCTRRLLAWNSRALATSRSSVRSRWLSSRSRMHGRTA